MATVQHTFSVSALYKQEVESLSDFLRKRWSFWLALFSCIAFLIGNMVGQHGFSAFWKSVWGKERIVFDGTVMPIRIPDPERWAGGDRHGFRDVPASFLIDVPVVRTHGHCVRNAPRDRRIISVDYMGNYETGGEYCGSHPAVDILAPKGTPVYAIGNSIVHRTEERDWGFGNTVVLEHPDVPDPREPGAKTTLYSVYAHLGRILVAEGEMVRKGQQIALSGQTGLATAPHLHFGVETADAPFHPSWPFTTAQATEAGLSFTEAVDHALGQEEALKYTVHPLVYVQSYLNGVPAAPVYAEESTVVVASTGELPAVAPLAPLTWKERMHVRVRSQREKRLVKLPVRKAAIALVQSAELTVPPPVETPSALAIMAPDPLAHRSSQSEGGNPNPVTLSGVEGPSPSSAVASITMLHDRFFEPRSPEQLVLFARDAEGNFLHEVNFEGTITLEASFGEAEFSPAVLTASHFDDRGRAFVTIVPRGGRTIVPEIYGAFTATGQPLANAESPSKTGTSRVSTASARASGEAGK